MYSMRISVLLLFSFVCLVSANAQKNFYKGTLRFADGSEKSGLIKMPSDASDKKIDFKKTEADSKESIESDKLTSFTVTEGAVKVEFVRTFYFDMGSKKKSKYAGWFTILQTGPVTLYSNNYDNFSSREIFNPSSSHNNIFLVKRTAEEVPTTIGLYFPSSVNHNQTFRKYAAEYFSDYAELAKRLSDKEFKLEDIGQVVDLYNKWTAKKK